MPRTQPLRIGVPLGTVVKRKRGGTLLGELTAAGQTLVVARGGKGGLGVVKPRESQQTRSKFIEQVCLPPITALPTCLTAITQAEGRLATSLSPAFHLHRVALRQVLTGARVVCDKVCKAVRDSP